MATSWSIFICAYSLLLRDSDGIKLIDPLHVKISVVGLHLVSSDFATISIRTVGILIFYYMYISQSLAQYHSSLTFVWTYLVHRVKLFRKSSLKAFEDVESILRAFWEFQYKWNMIS